MADKAKHTKPRILVLISNKGSATIRIAPFLDALSAAGSIAGYCFYDRDLHALGPHYYADFSHIIAQRNLSKRQFRWLTRSEKAFIYDIDDYLLHPLKPPNRKSTREIQRIIWCLDHARTVLTPSRQLAANLTASLKSNLSSRLLMIENGLQPGTHHAPNKKDGPAKTLLWVSSYQPQFKESAPGLVAAIATAAKQSGLSINLAGTFPPEIIAAFASVTHIPMMSFRDYRSFIARQDGAIAIAPLPVTTSEPEKSWFDSKSDIKIVEFHGHGIPGIYSDSPTYRQTDIAPKLLIKNQPEDWAAAITKLANAPWTGLSQQEVDLIQVRRAFAQLATRLYDHAIHPAPRQIITMDLSPAPQFTRRIEVGLRKFLRRNRA